MNKHFLLGLLSLVLFAATTLLFVYGSYTIDSWNYYDQALSGQYNDWHSPLLSFTWRVISKATNSFASFYFAQMALYWLIFYLLFEKINRRIWLVLLLGCSVFFLFIPQYVIKDTQLALTWGLAFLLLIRNKPGYRLFFTAIILLLLTYGFWLRINILPALLPALYLLTEQYILPQGSRLKKAGVVAGLSVILVLGYFVFTYGLLKARKDYPEYKLMLLDVVGISKETGKDYLPEIIQQHKDYRRDTVLLNYTTASFDKIYWPDTGKNVPDPNEEIVKAMKKSWRSAILSHPFIYLGNRIDGYLYYLRIKKRFAREEYWNTTFYVREPNPVGIKLEMNKIIAPFMILWGSLYTTIFYDPWLWLLMNALLFGIFLRRYLKRRTWEAKALSALQLSAVLFMLCQFPVFQHDRDFRYNYWNVIALLIGLACLFYKGSGSEDASPAKGSEA